MRFFIAVCLALSGRGVRWCRGRCGVTWKAKPSGSAPSPDRSEPLGCRRGNFFNPEREDHGGRPWHSTGVQCHACPSAEKVSGQSSRPSLPGTGRVSCSAQKYKPGLHPKPWISVYSMPRGNVAGCADKECAVTADGRCFLFVRRYSGDTIVKLAQKTENVVEKKGTATI